MGKRRIIAETGAGQHGVATATVCAKFGLECVVYMGEEDMRRQRLNVYRMELMGARVVPVTAGGRAPQDGENGRGAWGGRGERSGGGGFFKKKKKKVMLSRQR